MMSTDSQEPTGNRVLLGSNPLLSLPKLPVHTSQKVSQPSHSEAHGQSESRAEQESSSSTLPLGSS
jgi:hypothetical protein